MNSTPEKKLTIWTRGFICIMISNVFPNMANSTVCFYTGIVDLKGYQHIRMVVNNTTSGRTESTYGQHFFTLSQLNFYPVKYQTDKYTLLTILVDSITTVDPVFIAGTTYLGQRAARNVVVSMSSQIPHAHLAITSADAGAIMNRSAFFASETCFTSNSKSLSKVSVMHLFPDRVSNVSGSTKCFAFGVMMTCTSAPACVRRLTR